MQKKRVHILKDNVLSFCPFPFLICYFCPSSLCSWNTCYFSCCWKVVEGGIYSREQGEASWGGKGLKFVQVQGAELIIWYTLSLFQICSFWSSEHNSKSRGDFISTLWSAEYSDPGTTRDEDLSVRASQKYPSEDLISLSKEDSVWSFIKAKFHVVRSSCSTSWKIVCNNNLSEI